MGRYLVGGVVVDDAGVPVPPSDPYYYNAAEDAQRQVNEQVDESELAGKLAANANSIAVGGQPPFPELLPESQGGTMPNPADALGAVTGGAKWLLLGVGALVLLSLIRRGQR
jgi:hypothetical protein